MKFEVDIIVGLQSVASEGLTVFFDIISLLGSYLGFIIVFLIFFILRRKLSYVFGVCFLGGVGLNYILKVLIGRDRPYVAHPEIANLSNTLGESMPSSHALCAIILAIFVCYFVFTSTKKPLPRIAAATGMSILAALTFVSRLYLGLHYLTDILLGAIIGAIIACMGIVWMQKRKVKDAKQK